MTNSDQLFHFIDQSIGQVEPEMHIGFFFKQNSWGISAVEFKQYLASARIFGIDVAKLSY